MTVNLRRWPPPHPAADTLYLCLGCRQAVRGRSAAILPPQAFALLLLLATNGEHMTTLRAAQEIIWGEREDGGPLLIADAVRLSIQKIRQATRGLGVVIENQFNQGYRFRLEG